MSIARVQLNERGPCPLCGNPGYHVHMDFQSIPVRRCDSCGFMYSGKMMTGEDLAAYYATQFGSERHRMGQVVNARVNAGILRRLVPLKDIRSVLDVGAGYGFLLDSFRKHYGMATHGVEPSESEAAYARDVMGQDVYCGFLSESPFTKDQFDLVITCEVIEHVPSPNHFLSELADRVAPGGYLVVMTDNFESSVVRKMGPEWMKWIPHAHISHFSGKTLTMAIEKLDGFRIVSTYSYTPWENWVQSFRTKGRDVSECFNLEETLKSEMGGKYPLYGLRQQISPIWASLTGASALEGSLMFIASKKS